MKKTTILFFMLMAFCGYSQTITVEAESGKRYRGASIQSCSSCSNLEQVGDIGGNSVESSYFTSTVTVATKGVYTMNLSFSSGDTRTIFVSPNGSTPVEVALNSGDWGVVGNQDIQVNLNVGTNTIKFYNYTGYAPNIDKFTLTLAIADNPCTTCVGPIEAESGTVFAPATIQGCDTCSGGQQVGDMGYSDRYFTKDVMITTAGTYRVYVSYSTGAPRSLSITANGTTTVSGLFYSTDWDVVFVKALDIYLAAGNNTLKFHNPGNWAPNVDKFTLELLDSNADLVDLKINGTTISGFSSSTVNYNLDVPFGSTIPQITLGRTSNSTATYAINNTSTASTVTVTSSDATNTKIYTVNYTLLPLSVEAESGTLYRGASVQSCSSCSNLQQVGDVGGTSAESAYFTSNVTMSIAGTYTMNLSFSSGDTRTIFISPNGATPVEVALNSGDWGVVGTQAIQLELNAGTNTIKFYNYNGYAPNIDKYTLVLSNPTNPCTTCLGPFEAENGIVFAPATVQGCGSCSGGQQVGDMGFSDRYFTQDVMITTPGTYRVYISYSSGTPRSLSVTANETTTSSGVFNSTDWDVVFVKSLDIYLAAGNNTLKFHNPGDWAPSVDKFRLELLNNNANLDDLKINGTTVSSFSSSNTSYTVSVPYGSSSIPQISFASTENTSATYVITQASSAPSFATVVVTSSDGATTKTYTINYAIAIEAESGKIYRGASIQNCSSCSNLQQVGDMGGTSEESAYFVSNITVPTAGIYTMNLSFSSGDTRTIFISPNGYTPIELALNSGDWGVVGNQSFQISLNAGTNAIKFYNYSGYAPNIDKYTLTLTTPANPCTTCVGPFEAENGIVFAPATVQGCDTCSGGQHVTDMGFSDRYFTQDVTIITPGTYRAYVSYSSGTPRSISVTANDSNTVSAVCNSIDWDVVFVKELDITLSAGNNTLKFHNPGDWAPSIDKFRLELIQATITYYADVDGDGYGAGVGVGFQSSTAPSGYSVNDDDCDDTNAAINPDATEIFDTIDNDCDGSVDEDTSLPSSLTFCKGATVAFAKGTTDLQLYTSTSPTAVALLGTTALSSKVYYATLNGSARTAVTVTVNLLPSTPASMTTSDAVLCKHIGTTNEVTYSVPVPVLPAVAIASYSWTLPVGVTAISAINTNSITVNFAGSALNNTSVGGIGTISARAISAAGCSSAPRSLLLTSKLPTSPTSLTMTSIDSTPHFKGIITPAVVEPPTPAVYGLVGLNTLTKITKVGPYMGTETVFTLTAATAPTAASYAWTLPAGVFQLSGGTSNSITVDFLDVEPGIGLLPIEVKSVGGCGSAAVARKLSLARALPTAPTALVLTDGVSPIVLTKVSAYTGKTTPLTLTATPASVQGATATSYAWILPSGVNIVSPSETTDVTVQQSVNTGTLTPEGAPIFEIRDFTAKSTGTASTITVNFAGVAEGTLSFPLTVFAINGAGNSKARIRTVTAAAATSPAITSVGGTTFNSCNSKTYSVVQTLGTSYTWSVPAGASFVQTGNQIVVDYTSVEASVGATVQVSCTASNGTGSSLPKVLNVKRVVCPVRLSDSSASAFSAKAYPNPSSSEFTIETSAKGAMSVKVYDMQGRLVEKANTNRVGSKLAAGTYNLIVNQGANTKSVRVIKK